MDNSPELQIPVILDVDTGIDDSVAIALAITESRIDPKLITTVAGNTTVENATYNTLNMVSWLKSDVPVAQGASKPLVRERLQLDGVHGGETGMGIFKFPPNDLKPYHLNAVDAMIEVLENNPKTVIICTAPTTNIANLITVRPDLISKIQIIVLLGGSIEQPDYPSFNFMADPEAMEILINKRIPMLLCLSDLGHDSSLNDAELEIVRNLNETGGMFATNFSVYHDRVCQNQVAMHDSCAVACICHPELFTYKPTKIECIEKDGDKFFKITPNSYDGNCLCCTSIDVPAFKHYMLENLKKAPH